MRQSSGSPVIRRATAVVFAVALVTLLALPGVAQAATYRSTLRLSTRYQTKARVLSVSGSISRKTKGKSVTIEIRKPGRSYWVAVKSAKISKYGRWSTRYTPRLAGRFYFRARYGSKLSRLVGLTVKRGPGKQSNIIMYSTTSVRDSGIWEVLKPAFLHDNPEYTVTGEQWKGTGDSLTFGAEQGLADVVFAHAPQDEKNRVAQGYAKNRKAVMYNFFEMIGPKTGGPTIAAAAAPTTAFQAIVDYNNNVANTDVEFWSRSDNSGTNQKEIEYWGLIGNPQVGQAWYKLQNKGMGALLNAMFAASTTPYSITDNASYYYQSKNWSTSGLTNPMKIIATDKTSAWVNDYSILEVVKARNPEGAADFSAWLRAANAQSIIANYGKVTTTEQLFYPNAGAY
jgi:tungstate transport system substrate-binding protein